MVHPTQNLCPTEEIKFDFKWVSKKKVIFIIDYSFFFLILSSPIDAFWEIRLTNKTQFEPTFSTLLNTTFISHKAKMSTYFIQTFRPSVRNFLPALLFLFLFFGPGFFVLEMLSIIYWSYCQLVHQFFLF